MRYRHGKSKHPLFKVWWGMKTRCSWEGAYGYNRYGGRGIKVCDEWMSSTAFFDWALSHGYEQGLELDRIDNDGNYGPDNCRFVTTHANTRNKSNNVFLTAWGETKILPDWAKDERCVVSLPGLRSRFRHGLRGEEALITPLRKVKYT